MGWLDSDSVPVQSGCSEVTWGTKSQLVAWFAALFLLLGEEKPDESSQGREQRRVSPGEAVDGIEQTEAA